MLFRIITEKEIFIPLHPRTPEAGEIEVAMHPLQTMPKWRLRRHFLDELESRTGDLDALWPDDKRLRAVRDLLTTIIANAVGCPDARFIPDDSFVAIYNNFRSCWGYDSLDDVELLMDIEEAFAIEFPEDNVFLGKASYLDLVRYIAEQSSMPLE